MKRKLTCIACPIGCVMTVDVEGGYVIKVSGHKCPRGETYARQEIEHPMRVLTSTVLTQGLELKMVPVRTNKPIPKDKLLSAMQEVKKVRLSKPVKVGQAIIKDLLGTGADLVATRDGF